LIIAWIFQVTSAKEHPCDSIEVTEAFGEREDESVVYDWRAERAVL
jgi:hypothetical protein